MDACGQTFLFIQFYKFRIGVWQRDKFAPLKNLLDEAIKIK